MDRYAKRESERHWVHLTAGENRSRYEEGHKKAGMGEVSIGNTIQVDTTIFEKVDFNSLISEAKNFMQKFKEC